MNEVKKIDSGTVIRTLLLVIALINQGLTQYGLTPIDAEATANFVAIAFSTITAAWAWWKNNDITRKARQANK